MTASRFLRWLPQQRRKKEQCFIKRGIINRIVGCGVSLSNAVPTLCPIKRESYNLKLTRNKRKTARLKMIIRGSIQDQSLCGFSVVMSYLGWVSWCSCRVRISLLPPRVTLPWRKRPWKMRRSMLGLLTLSSSHPVTKAPPPTMASFSFQPQFTGSC